MKPAINHQYLSRLIAHIVHHLGSRTGGPSRGFTAIEALVALAILSLVSVAFLSGLSTSFHATRVADIRSTAQALAETHMEFIRSQSYCDNVWDYTVTTTDATSSTNSTTPCWWDPANDRPPLLSSEYAGYVVEADSLNFDEDNDGLDDDGIRRVTVAVKVQDEGVLSVQNYEVER